MLNAVIIDDEEHCIKTLAWTLDQYCSNDVEVTGKYNNPEEGLAAIKNSPPDIVFLDVEMPGLNGIELLERLGMIRFEVIFTTAYDFYAIKAIKLNALDYLLKPIDKDELAEAVNRVKAKRAAMPDAQSANGGKSQKQTGINKIALSTLAGLQFIHPDDIVRIEGESNYCNFFLKDKKKILLSKKLGDAEALLKDNQFFFRAHKSHIINLKYVDKYVRGEGGEIIMQDGTSITLSRSKKEEFLKFFSRM
jgi:two-component system LytT family response regulator